MSELGLNEFYSPENFRLAYNRLKTAWINNPGYHYYQDLYQRDLENFGINLEDNLKTLIHEVKDGIYSPSVPLKLYIPKPNKLIRPITVLNFIDLLIYQAIANIIAEYSYENLYPSYNKEVFGHIYDYRSDKPSDFFFVKWENQWREFESKTKQLYSQGYQYIIDFDLASFYDTLDHYLLDKFIRDLGISEAITGLLLQQLETWTRDFSRGNHTFKHGVPQGPLPSAFLSEVYLHYIDQKVLEQRRKSLDFEYIRYVDDIRIFTKTEKDAKRYFAFLDLLSRDLGLIPQSNKTNIQEISDIRDISKINEYFANIKLQKRRKDKLSEKVQEYLVQKVLGELDKEAPDKTTIKFSAYKLELDNRIKESLLKNSYKIPHLYDEICFYLAKFPADKDIQAWVNKQLTEEPLYVWTHAIIIKHFNPQDLILNLWRKYSNSHKYWYVQYFLLDRISTTKPEFNSHIKANEFCELLKRKILSERYYIAQDTQIKELIVLEMCIDKSILLALEGRRLSFETTSPELEAKDSDLIDCVPIPLQAENLNRFLKASLRKTPTSYIMETLLSRGIENSGILFESSAWEEELYERLKEEFRAAINLFESRPHGIWMIYMDNFNNLLVEHMLRQIDSSPSQGMSYATLLDYRNLLKKHFPQAYKCFKKIHDVRSTRVAHPKDRNLKVTKPLSWYESKAYQEREFTALKEIIEEYRLACQKLRVLS